MSEYAFGDRVTFTSVVGKLRRFYDGRRLTWDGRDFASAPTEEPPPLRDVTLSLMHGRRSLAHQYGSDSDFTGFDVLADPGDVDVRGQVTMVSLVRVPVRRVRRWYRALTPESMREGEDKPMRGIVVGRTHRQCGRVTPDEYGNQWENRGSIPVVTVAAETDGSSAFYDVHLDDLRGDV